MTPFCKVTFGLFVSSLPACYFTAMPAVLCAVIFLATYAEERFVSYASRASLEDIVQQLEKHQTALNALNFRMGMGPMPSTKIVEK